MKKIILVLSFLFVAATATFADTSIQFFTRSQATRVVNYLNDNPEILIYCGCYPDYEGIYVQTTDVWMERYSSVYYEIWIYGFDVKTNEIISTPIDLNCIWIRGNNGYPASVAQRLGFVNRICGANFKWRMPTYKKQTRRVHPADFHHTYTKQPNVENRTPHNENYQPRYVGNGNNNQQTSKPNNNTNNNQPRQNSGVNGSANHNNSSTQNNNSGNQGNRGTQNNNNKPKVSTNTTTNTSSARSSSSSSSRSSSSSSSRKSSSRK